MAVPGDAAYRCIDHVFSVGASDPELSALIARLLAPFRCEAQPVVHYNIVEWDAPDMVGFAVYGNATILRSMHEADVALAHVLWEINQAAVASAGDRLVLHAAAAERQGRAVVLGAPSGSGKTTLVAALVAAGWGYLTDDVALIDGAGRVVAYPKPIGLDLGAHDLLATVAPPTAADARFLGEHGFVTPADLGGSIGVASAVAAFVVPSYQPGAATRLEPLDPAEALSTAAEQSFRVDEGLDEVARTAAIETILEGCPCFRLIVDDLAEAVRCIADIESLTI